jgi:hypothetical protein
LRLEACRHELIATLLLRRIGGWRVWGNCGKSTTFYCDLVCPQGCQQETSRERRTEGRSRVALAAGTLLVQVDAELENMKSHNK